MIVPFPENSSLVTQLRFASALMRGRKLDESAKWLSELLESIPVDSPPKPLDVTQLSSEYTGEDAERAMQNDFYKVYFEDPRAPDYDLANLGRALYDLHEYNKCTHRLSVREEEVQPNSVASFVLHSAVFIASEERAEAIRLEGGKSSGLAGAINQGGSGEGDKDIQRLQKHLKNQGDRLDGFHWYLLGIVLKRQRKREAAREALVRALQKVPVLWSAWVELLSLLTQEDWGAVAKQLPWHWMRNFWQLGFWVEQQQQTKALGLAGALSDRIGNSSHLAHTVAAASYHLQDYETSVEHFERLLKQDPFRYEGIELYSNILYIKQNWVQLAHLAHHAVRNAKYRPETCCAVGNYYSLRGQHPKAVIHFKRAVKLDPSFLSAWTLMGHQYLEMKNTSKAIECYRTAVDIDTKDFRAWYGLGQTYEIHEMLQYAIHYFQMAAQARPHDSRMWTALAQCYQKLEWKPQAERALKRAHQADSASGDALCSLGLLYQKSGHRRNALRCFETYLAKTGGFGHNEANQFEVNCALLQDALEHNDPARASRFRGAVHTLKHIDPPRASKLLALLASQTDASIA